MRHIVAVISAVAVAATLLTLVYFFWERRPFQPAPPPPPSAEEVVQRADETIARVRRDHLALAVADDGEGSDELQTFVAHAYLNLSEARGNLSIEQIFNKKLLLSAPSEEGSKWPRFISAAWTGSEENFARAQKQAVRLLTAGERQADWKKIPCLRSVQRVVRPAKFGTIQHPERMEADGLVLLYQNTVEHTKFYGPPGSRACSG